MAAPYLSGEPYVTGVTASVPGFIEAFLVEPGADVYEGQVLARIGAQGLESSREVAQDRKSVV